MNREVMEKVLPFWGYKGSKKFSEMVKKCPPKIPKIIQNVSFVLIFTQKLSKINNHGCSNTKYSSEQRLRNLAETDDFAEIVHCN